MPETARGRGRERKAGGRPRARGAAAGGTAPQARASAPPEGATPATRRGLTYRDAGVDIDAKMRAIQRLRMISRGTFREGVLSEIGSFGGLFELQAAGTFKNPVLVSSTDGVGTKVKVAIQTGSHRSIGMDLVNHCVNDILVQGATPLFFLDYIAMGRVDPNVLVEVATGMARACRDAGCALIGGETAEMPDLYRAGDYDLAGFIVGVVDKEHVIDGTRIAAGDLLFGLPSSGLHTNGYSLARRLMLGRRGMEPGSQVPELGRTVAEELLQVHRSYLPVLRGLIPTGALYGLAHITGGGLTDNVPRILPRGVSARIDLGSWPVPPVFRYLQREGRVAEDEMLRTFNMGIGMVLVVPMHRESEVTRHLEAVREKYYRIGEIVRGNRRVVFNREPQEAPAPAGGPGRS